MNDRLKILILSLCVLFQAACSTNAVYTDESFAYDSLFKLRTDGSAAMACESARRSLLGQGYIIETTSSEGVKARKAYKSESSQNTFIEMNIVCLPEATGSTVFATGVLTTYALKMSSSSASVGVSAIGSISLPIGQSADSLVKVSEETIDDKDFYRRFFAAVDTILGDMQAGRATPEAVVEPAAPAPVPESTPLQTVPAPVPVPVPAQVAPVMPSELPPVQETPAIVPETVPEAAPPIVPEAAPDAAPQEAPMTVPEHLPAHLIESFK